MRSVATSAARVACDPVPNPGRPGPDRLPGTGRRRLREPQLPGQVQVPPCWLAAYPADRSRSSFQRLGQPHHRHVQLRQVLHPAGREPAAGVTVDGDPAEEGRGDGGHRHDGHQSPADPPARWREPGPPRPRPRSPGRSSGRVPAPAARARGRGAQARRRAPPLPPPGGPATTPLMGRRASVGSPAWAPGPCPLPGFVANRLGTAIPPRFRQRGLGARRGSGPEGLRTVAPLFAPQTDRP